MFLLLSIELQYVPDFSSDLIRPKSFGFLKKQTKIPDFSDVIYTTSKNELKMMWLTKNMKVWDLFPPQKWEVNACSR